MHRTLQTGALSLVLTSALAQTHTFTTAGTHFTLDGRPARVLPGELHRLILDRPAPGHPQSKQELQQP